MQPYFRNRLVQIGLFFAVVGCGPLLAIIVLNGLGLWPDPNPNPIGPGLLFAVSMWPALICLVVGVIRVRSGYVPATSSDTPLKWYETPAARIIAGLVGGLMLLRGLFDVFVMGWVNRGSVSGVLVGIVGLWWAAKGRLPAWFQYGKRLSS